ncbi:hemogen isoform X2 [Hyla sarda]|uniref:hemogen isoform X2 n=2 Tax=Hyla sarda TaxID=327740 RepID=UPI0024C3DE3C|nr:hemogen isoform X2 [Hyla sarda]
MGDFEKDHHYSEPSGASASATGHHEVKQESPVNIRRRLRDREMLKRKKEEAQQKDTYQEQTSSKRQRKTQGTGRGRRKQVKEREPEPYPEPHSEPEPKPESEHEPIHELQHEPRQEQHFEMEAEKKFELMSEVPQDHVEHEKEPLVHHEDSPPTVSKEDTADVTLLIHEDAGGHLPQESTSLQQALGYPFYEPVPKTEQHIPDKEVMSDLGPATETHEVLGFPLEQEQVEHQYYTPLL